MAFNQASGTACGGGAPAAGDSMTEQEALEAAIEALGIECARLASEARDWDRYGDRDQVFNKAEGQNLAAIILRYEMAIGVLQLMVTRMRQSTHE
jgi:Ser/Thr protein kinase RdoA (MazF antagonist)